MADVSSVTLRQRSAGDLKGDAESLQTEEEEEKPSFEIVKNFQLAWFGMTMGWGGTALVIAGFPGASGTFHDVLQWVGTVIWLWNACYWCLYTGLFTTRCIQYTKGVIMMLDHPAQFTFFGCMPMGLATVAIGFINFGEKLGMSHATAITIATGIYWIDVALSIISAFVPAYYMVVRQKHSFQSMSALWLLPFVANVVAAACGGTLSEKLDGQEAVVIVFTSLILWGMGVLIAGMIISIYLARLVFYGMPPKGLGNSTWLVLGPIGQGANGILLLGRKAGVLARSGILCTPGVEFLSDTAPLCSFGHMAPGFTMLLGLGMWGLGTWWLLTAGTLSLHNCRKFFLLMGRHTPFGHGVKGGTDNIDPSQPDYIGLPFNLGWWGIIFPFCTQIFSTYQLYNDTHFGFFMWMGRIYACILVFLSCMVHVKTLHHVFDGRIWESFKPPPGPLSSESEMFDGGAERDIKKRNRKEAMAVWKHTVMHPLTPAPKASLYSSQDLANN